MSHCDNSILENPKKSEYDTDPDNRESHSDVSVINYAEGNIFLFSRCNTVSTWEVSLCGT